MAHPLDRLLKPESIAVVGATRRAGAVGNAVVRNLLQGGFAGPLYAVNPNYEDVEGVPCLPSLAALPRPVQQVIFAVGDAHLEAALDEAIAHGVESCVIYSSLVLPDDRSPPLRQRVAQRIASAGLTVCGGNGMGYYNFRDRVWACGFDTRPHHADGHITLISQSGAGMSGILDVDERLDFNFAVSTGQELSVCVEDYIDWALAQPETRVIGLFLETSRKPQRLLEVLERAARQGVPVVAVKVGRTELSARLAVSHCGALAGSDRVYDAVFDRCGVQRVDDMDELANALIMFAAAPRPAVGGVVSLHDSGGERQLFIDLAAQRNVPLTTLSAATVERLEGLLDPGLPAVNPLDGWSAGGTGAAARMAQCFAALVSDENAALGAVVHDRTAGGLIHPEYADYLRAGSEASGKPVFLVSARQGTGADPLAVQLTRDGFPVLDGVGPFLAGARCLLEWRDYSVRPAMSPPEISPAVIARWRARLAAGVPGEVETLALLAEAGIPAVRGTRVESEAELLAAAGKCDFPVVLKTSNPGIAHKLDVGGVILDIRGEQQLLEAYRRMAAALGPIAVLEPMVTAPGVEMILGFTSDEQFGPVVLMGIGGTHAEALDDVVAVLPRFDACTARRRLAGLKLRRLLDGARAPVDIDAFCRAAAALSALVPHIADLVASIDINPVKVLARGCIALDALVVPAPNARLPGIKAEAC